MRDTKRIFLVLFAVTLSLFFSACRYSPWEIDPDCERDIITKNLDKLAVLQTQMSGQTSFKVALVGDSHMHPLGMQKVIEKIVQRNDIAFALILGDLTDTGLEIEFDWTCKILGKLDIPYLPVIGNHDAISFGKEIWKKYFGPFDYSFTFLESKFIAYNDNAFEFPGAPDYNWMAREATVSGGEVRYHTIGVSHIPPVTDVHNADEALALRQFLFDNGFDLTVHGHLHRFWLWSDEFGVDHYIVSDTQGVEYSIMTVYQDRIELENCSPECTAAIP